MNKIKFFKGLKMARKLRVGDKVCCGDGSYSFGIRQGKYVDGISNTSGDRENLTVAALDLDITKGGLYPHPCDTLVTDGHGNFWFVLSECCLLLPEKHTITVDGKNIEISDESYENLKRQLT